MGVLHPFIFFVVIPKMVYVFGYILSPRLLSGSKEFQNFLKILEFSSSAVQIISGAVDPYLLKADLDPIDEKFGSDTEKKSDLDSTLQKYGFGTNT